MSISLCIQKQYIKKFFFGHALYIAFLLQQIKHNATFRQHNNFQVTKIALQMISFLETRTLIIVWPPAALKLCGNRSGGSADTFGQARPCSVRFGYPGRQCVVLLTTLPLRHKTPPSPRASASLSQSFVFFPPPTSSFVVSYCVFSITLPLVSTLVAVSCLDSIWKIRILFRIAKLMKSL